MASNREEQILVNGKDGLRAVIDASQLDESRFQPGTTPQVLMRLENGTSLLIPLSLLQARDDGSYYLPFSAADLLQTTEQTQMIAAVGAKGEPTLTIASIPVVAEEVTVGKREVEAGKVRIHKSVNEREEVIDEPLLSETIDVVRVDVNQFVDAPVPVRYEGDTMIISLLEEVLVVEKRLMVREEIHVTRKQSEIHAPQTVTLRSEDVSVERIAVNGGQSPD